MSKLDGALSARQGVVVFKHGSKTVAYVCGSSSQSGFIRSRARRANSQLTGGRYHPSLPDGAILRVLPGEKP